MGLRDLIIPDPGKTLVQVDQSGADAFCVAMLTRSGNYRKLFEYGIKPHTYTALHLFKNEFDAESPGITATEAINIPIEKLPSTPGWPELNSYVKNSGTRYYIGKKVEHSGNYGERENTFITDVLNESDGRIRLTPKQGKEFLGIRASLFPEIQNQFQSRIRQQLENNNRTLRNLFGYPITFIGVWDDSLFRKAYAWIPQSTVAIITALAYTELQERLRNREAVLWAMGLDILQDGHDSILSQCFKGVEYHALREIQKHMNRELVNPWGEKFTMKSEAQSGSNWRDMKSI